MAAINRRLTIWPGDPSGPKRLQKISGGGAKPYRLSTSIIQIKTQSPWEEDYFRLLETRLGDDIIVSQSQSEPHKRRAIQKVVRRSINEVHVKSHENVLSFTEIYVHDNDAYLVSELLFCTLDDITCTPLGSLPLSEIAQVASSVLLALDFLHSEMQCSHGNIQSSMVLFTQAGTLKLGAFVTSLQLS